MCIIENQQLWYDNILSYRTRIEESSLLSLLRHVEKNIDALDLKIRGDIIFSINEEICTDSKTIWGVELLIPVDKRFESDCHYVFKPRFKLENAVVCKFSGNPGEFKAACKNLYDYTSDNHLQTITDVYYHVKNICGESCIADLYIGTSGNSL
ncbi:MAG: DUF5085 family protein [Ruminococcus sp.]|nr:DUF5085 family protein [Ruminococcus sp.]